MRHMRQVRVAQGYHFEAISLFDETSAWALPERRLGIVAGNNEQVAAPTSVSQNIGDR
ncbi:MAG TPA: hypothetical protein VFA89_12505 [Terriglobales bacterium]|nr:hypothetical protein [Terriglobales bacterium]